MNKTIFNLDYKISLIIISVLGILLGFLSNAFYVNGIIELIFYIFRFILFIGVYLLFYVVEKHNEFKEANKRMVGYLVVSSLANIIFSIFSTTHILSSLFLTLSGVVCFWVIFAFVMEILNVCIENKIIKKIMSVNEKIGSVVSNPIIKLVDSKITRG